MRVELLRLEDNQKVIFDIDLNHPLDSEGGEGAVYKSTLQGKEYVIKPIELHPDTKRKYKSLRERIKNLNGLDTSKNTLKERVLKSFIPYAQNFQYGEIFNYQHTTYIDVFAYSFIKGKKLSQYLSENPQMEMGERLDICIKILELLDFLQIDCGVHHADIFEDNFIIDSNGDLFPIDSTSCGYFIWNSEHREEEPVYQARNRGKSENWGLPEPKDFAEEGVTTQYTDRWFSARLVWRILTNQMHPYTFLTRVDADSLDDLIYCIADDEPKSWPPIFYVDPDYIDQEMYDIYESYMQSTFGARSETAKIFYRYFIEGYKSPKSRPSCKSLKDKLKRFALTNKSRFRNSEKVTSPRIEGNRVIFTYHNEIAERVFLVGDFNNWNQNKTAFVKLANGVWRVQIPCPPRGKYAYKFLVHGNYNYWTFDPSHGERDHDGYGGHNSILYIP
jgi:hypothetical protein